MIGIGSLVIFGGADSQGLDLSRVSRIKVSIDTVVSGKPVSGEWIVPAIKYWEVPPMWLQNSSTLRTVRSPFETVFLPLPTGEALAVDIPNNNLNMTWYWRPVHSPLMQEPSTYYFLDSFDKPMVLTKYPVGWENCPKNSPISRCNVSSERSLLSPGPFKVPPGVGASDFDASIGRKRHEELLRFGFVPPKPMMFVNVRGELYQSPALLDDPQFGSMMKSFARPTITRLDLPARHRLRRLAGAPGQLNLAYHGLNSWGLSESLSGLETNELRLTRTFHRTTRVTPDDVEVGAWTGFRVKQNRLTQIVGTIKYLSETIEYDPVTNSNDDTLPVLVDASRQRLILLHAPNPWAIWMTPP